MSIEYNRKKEEILNSKCNWIVKCDWEKWPKFHEDTLNFMWIVNDNVWLIRSLPKMGETVIPIWVDPRYRVKPPYLRKAA